MPRRPQPILLYASFAAVYLIWGSTFAASKFAVTTLPPYLASGVRFSSAGLLLVAFAAWRGVALPRSRREWGPIAMMAVFHVVLSSGLNMAAMPHVASNQSALLNASAALWIALVGATGPNPHRLTARIWLGLALGFFGVGFLLWPSGGFSFANFGWQLLIIFACFSWAVGTRYYQGLKLGAMPLMFFGLEMLGGGLVLGTEGFAFGEGPHWSWDLSGLLALAFLAVFSSCLAYTAYGYLMSHTTPARLSTYAYVNPAIAAVVGWLALGERMSATQLVGTAVILAGVVLVSLPEAGTPALAQPSEPTG